MKRRLLLSGPIGCGKSTMIRNALGEDAVKAGGYVTLRVFEQERLRGFNLAPAAALADTEKRKLACRFLDFSQTPRRNPAAFSVLGRDMLLSALESPYAVIDEFGGMELLISPFMEALQELLASDVPCIGVFKTPQASRELTARIDMGDNYRRAYEALRNQLLADPDTELLSTSGRYDAEAKKQVELWVQKYVRK